MNRDCHVCSNSLYELTLIKILNCIFYVCIYNIHWPRNSRDMAKMRWKTSRKFDSPSRLSVRTSRFCADSNKIIFYYSIRAWCPTPNVVRDFTTDLTYSTNGLYVWMMLWSNMRNIFIDWVQMTDDTLKYIFTIKYDFIVSFNVQSLFIHTNLKSFGYEYDLNNR